jgi:putative ABC transport system permease protein
MSSLWKKAVRDLRDEGGRSASIVAALAIGIAGFLAVLSAYPILTRSLNEGYRATNPASAVIYVDRLDEGAALEVAGMQGLEGAEARRTARGRIRAGGGEWRNLLVFARSDFAASRIGMVFPEKGAWPPSAGEIAIERDAMQVGGFRIGDDASIRIETADEKVLRVSGTARDVGQAQARMENIVYGYARLETLESLGVLPFYNELAIRVSEGDLDETHIRQAAEGAAKILEARGSRVARIYVPEPGQHPHAKLMGLLTLSIAVFGFFILMLSGIIVFNVLTALLTGQRRQIGIMKALGGTRARIARLYVAEACMLGTAALAAAMPIGVLSGRWLCRAMGSFLNFDIVGYGLPAWIYALTLAVGLAVPILSALIPVWLGTRVSVRDALAQDGGSGRVYGRSLADRALARFGGASRAVLMAFRNMARARLRVALTLVTLVAGGIFFMSALDVRRSIMRTFNEDNDRSPADLSIALAEDYPAASVELAIRGAAGVSEAEAWESVKAAVSNPDGERRNQDEIALLGLPRQSRLAAFEIALGRALGEDADQIVVNNALYEKLGKPQIGSVIKLEVAGEGAAYGLRGVAREGIAPPTAYALRSSFAEGGRKETGNAVRVALDRKDPSALEEGKAAVESALASAGMRLVSATTKEESRIVIYEHVRMINVFLLVVSAILGSVGALGMVTTVSLNMGERRRETGVLKAIGATPGRIASIVVIEGAATGALSWIIAAAVSGPLGKAIGEAMIRFLLRFESDMPMLMEPSGILIWLAVAVAAGALASLGPALRTARMPVRDALAYE